MHRKSVFAVLVAAAMASALPAQGLLTYQGQVLAYAGPNNTALGDPAPGTANGELFGGSSNFDSPVVDDNGFGFFRAQLVSSTGTALSPTYLQRGYYYGDLKGNLSLALRGGDPEPSGAVPGAILSTSTSGVAMTGSPRISRNGFIMFGASFWDFTNNTVTTSNDTALYWGAPGSFLMIAREGSLAPNCGGATYSQAFSGMSQQPTCINNAGQVLFQSSLAGTGVVTANNAAWFTGPASSVQLMLRKGDTLPGGDGSVVSALGFVSQMNSLGWVATDVSLGLGTGTPAVTASNDRALWLHRPGIGLTQLMREGDASPFSGATYNIASNAWSVSTSSTTFNTAGEIILNVELSGTGVSTGVDDRAIVMFSPAGQTPIIRRGAAIPGMTGLNWDTVNTSTMCLNDSGTITFASTMSGAVTAADDSALWTGTPGNFAMIMREGDLAPGAGGATFGSPMGSFTIMNGSNQVIFVNTLSTGGSSTWSWDPVIGLQAIFLSTDSIEVQPGVFQSPFGTGGVQFTNGDSRPLSFNDDGTTVVRVSMNSGAAIMSVRVGSLRGVPDEISQSAGGVQNLYLTAGTNYSGFTYIVAGSASGTSPGTNIGGVLIPLNFDLYTNFTLLNANTPPFYVNTFGTLDTNGRATAQIVIPAGLTGLAGATVHHAYGLINGLGVLTYASEAQPLEFLP